MIRFDQVTYRYPQQSDPVLRDFTTAIEAGNYLLITGPSGAGKSTLLRCLNGLVPHFHGGAFGGVVQVNGIDTRDVRPAALSRTVGFVGQDPEKQTVMDRVEDEIAFGPENHGLARSEIRRRVEEALDLLSIAHLRERDLSTLSGGERQRVVIAAAMAMGPQVLALDEPTSQLDPWGAEATFAILERLNADLGTTIVLVEHRLERVLASAERLLILGGRGQVLGDGPPGEVAGRLTHPPPLIRLGQALEWRPLPLTVRDARRWAQALPPLPPPPEETLPDGPPIVECQQLHFQYGDRPILRDVSLTFTAGSVNAIMGRNGAGKTTLLKHFNGLLRPSNGRVLVAGEEITGRPTQEIARQVGYLPQNPTAMLFNESVRGELAFTMRSLGVNGDIEATLKRLGLEHLATRNPQDLSTGERQRVALAAVLIGQPRVLLLDEPTRGMDNAWKAALAQLLRDLAAEGVTIIMTTHDVELVAACAHRVVLLGHGEVIADDTPRRALSGSLTHATQINRVFGNPYLVLDDVLAPKTSKSALPVAGEVVE